jgi:hypothetical protein
MSALASVVWNTISAIPPLGWIASFFAVALAMVIMDELGKINLAHNRLLRWGVVRFLLPFLFWLFFFYALFPAFKASGNFGPSFLEYSFWMPVVTGIVIFLTGLVMHFGYSTSKRSKLGTFFLWLMYAFFFLTLVAFPTVAILDSITSDTSSLGGAATAGGGSLFWHGLNSKINDVIATLPLSQSDGRFFLRGVLPFLMAFVIAVYVSLDRFIAELDMEREISRFIGSGNNSDETGEDPWARVVISSFILAGGIAAIFAAINFFDYPIVNFLGALGEASSAGAEHASVMYVIGQLHLSTVIIIIALIVLSALFVTKTIMICMRCVSRVTLGAASVLLVGRSGDQGRNETTRDGLISLVILFLTFTTFILEHDQKFPGETFAFQSAAADLTGTAKTLYAVDEVVSALGGDVFDVYDLSVPGVFNIPPELLTTNPDLIQLGFDFSEVTHQRQNFFLSLFVLAFRTALVGAFLVTILGSSTLSSAGQSNNAGASVQHS